MSAKVPIAVACSLIAFALGGLAGVAAMQGFGYRFDPEFPQKSILGNPSASGTASAPGGGGAPGAPGGGRGGRGGPGGGRGGPGGGRGPSAKTQLASLVTKLDQLTAKPLSITLTADEKKKVLEQLKGLADKDEISDEEADRRLKALLDLLKDKKETLEAAGYRWPGGGGGGFGGFGAPQPPNPFKEGDASKHLKSLDTTLGKA